MNRTMDTNTQEFLRGAKDECLRLFARFLPDAVKAAAEKLFGDAYKTTNFSEHHLFLDCYTALTNRESVLIRRLESSLRQLLERGIQTAYNAHRPGRESGAATAGAWALVDAATIDDEIRLQRVTAQFHARCGAEIRDLNLRVAGLFRQDTVKERENPFRPYLFSRSIYTAVGELKLPQEVGGVMIEQLTGELLGGVADLYHELNAYFEERGVAALLPGIAKAAEDGGSARADTADGGAGPADDAKPRTERRAGTRAPARREQASASAPDRRAAQSDFGAGPVPEAAPGAGEAPRPPGSVAGARAPAMVPKPKVEHLLRMVREKAASMGTVGTAGFPPAEQGGATSADGAFASANAWAPTFHAASAAAAAPIDFSDPRSAVGWLGGGQVIGDALQRFLLQEPGQAPGDAMPAAELAQQRAGGAVYRFLERAQPTRTEDIVSAGGEIRNLIFEDRHSLAGKAADAGEMMTIDVIGMIFEFILRDTQVPAEIRAQLGRLQFLILKVALIDPGLVTQKTHPARMLINRIGTVSIGLKPNDAAGARLTAEIRRIVEALLNEEVEGMPPFVRMLDEFEAFLARDLRSGDDNIERAVEAVEEAEKRSAYFSRLQAALRDAFVAVDADPFLKGFIETAWLRAIEKAEFSSPETAERYRKLVPELIWSIHDKRSERERSRLLAHLPQMLADLKVGLNAVKYAERQTFLSWLIENHTRAIKAVGTSGEYVSLTELRQRFEKFVAVSSTAAPEGPAARIDHGLISDTAEQLDVRLDQIDTVMEFGSDPEVKAEEAAPAQQRDARPHDDGAISRLRVGVPVEINIDGAPRRALLKWMSAGATSMILSLEGNDFPTTISVSLFRRLLDNHRARLVEAEPLFERAVSALLETADTVDHICE